MDALETEIKLLIIEALDLEDIGPDDIASEAPLFGDGLGLDSIDALELGVALKKKYGLKLEAGDAGTREHFYSIKTLSNLIRTQKA